MELTAEIPSYLHSPVIAGPVVAHRGPFRLSGEWWENSGWALEEWDIEIEASGLYRLLHTPDGWFVDGIYD